jgi:hypothetical protein
MTAGGAAQEVSRHPLFTNPHVRMCAVITAVTKRWGRRGERTLRDAYRALGHVTGEEMIAAGIVARGADLAAYGHVSEQIMDICGLDGWTRVDTGRPEHATVVPRCAAYCEAYSAIAAPPQLCEIPFEWDNGCLDRINPGLEVWPTSCVHDGAAECVYTIRTRGGARAPAPEGRESAPATAVADAPTWTNPQAGLYALVARTVATFGGEGRAEIVRALETLGAHSGRFLVRVGLVAVGCGPGEAATLAGHLGAVAGFTGWEVRVHDDGAFSLYRPGNPYLPVFERFGAPADIQHVVAAWDRGWLAVVDPDVRLEIRADRWTGDGADVIEFLPRRAVR